MGDKLHLKPFFAKTITLDESAPTEPPYVYWMTFSAGGTFQLYALIATWHPSESIEAAMQVEERIAELGLSEKYALVLAQSLPSWENNQNMALLYWQLSMHLLNNGATLL